MEVETTVERVEQRKINIKPLICPYILEDQQRLISRLRETIPVNLSKQSSKKIGNIITNINSAMFMYSQNINMMCEDNIFNYYFDVDNGEDLQIITNMFRTLPTHQHWRQQRPQLRQQRYEYRKQQDIKKRQKKIQTIQKQIQQIQQEQQQQLPERRRIREVQLLYLQNELFDIFRYCIQKRYFNLVNKMLYDRILDPSLYDNVVIKSAQRLDNNELVSRLLEDPRIYNNPDIQRAFKREIKDMKEKNKERMRTLLMSANRHNQLIPEPRIIGEFLGPMYDDYHEPRPAARREAPLVISDSDDDDYHEPRPAARRIGKSRKSRKSKHKLRKMKRSRARSRARSRVKSRK